jgi:non-ribosomal peptide synthetase component F
MPSTAASAGLRMERLEVDAPIARQDLEVNFLRAADGWTLELRYASRLFERDRMRRLAGHFLCLLEDVVGRPDQPVHALRLLRDEEARQVLFGQTARR